MSESTDDDSFDENLFDVGDLVAIQSTNGFVAIYLGSHIWLRCGNFFQVPEWTEIYHNAVQEGVCQVRHRAVPAKKL